MKKLIKYEIIGVIAGIISIASFFLPWIYVEIYLIGIQPYNGRTIAAAHPTFYLLYISFLISVLVMYARNNFYAREIYMFSYIICSVLTTIPLFDIFLMNKDIKLILGYAYDIGMRFAYYGYGFYLPILSSILFLYAAYISYKEIPKRAKPIKKKEEKRDVKLKEEKIEKQVPRSLKGLIREKKLLERKLTKLEEKKKKIGKKKYKALKKRYEERLKKLEENIKKLSK